MNKPAVLPGERPFDMYVGSDNRRFVCYPASIEASSNARVQGDDGEFYE
jgi:hypothetical protein